MAVIGEVSNHSTAPIGSEKARLLRRAHAVARLRHPNLVRLLPLPGGAGLAPVVGEARRLADFTLPAGTFRRFDLEQVVRLLLDVLSGLSALHEVETDGQAFVHGQVSPQTIYIDEHGTARLVPLLNAHSMAGMTSDEPGYAAPECLAGRVIDARADVFSVGVMLWEALAGKRLFPDASPAGFAARLAGSKPPPIRLSADARWALPLCAVAERAIATEPSARFESACDFSNALAATSAQQLSRVDTDAWQDEAPTPVFQPRLHLVPLRTTTPQPAVLSLSPGEAAPSSLSRSSAVGLQPRSARRAGSARLAQSGLLMLALAAGGLWFSTSARVGRHVSAASQPATFAAPASAFPTARLVPLPTVSASASIAPPPAQVDPPATAAAASSSPPRAAPPRPRPAEPAASRPKPKPRARSGDYGI